MGVPKKSRRFAARHFFFEALQLANRLQDIKHITAALPSLVCRFALYFKEKLCVRCVNHLLCLKQLDLW
jgi:hypothetical protein